MAPELGSMAAELIAAADKYDVPLLKEKCEEKMVQDMSVQNAGSAAALAVLHRCPGLRDTAVKFIAGNLEVMATEGWARMLRDSAETAVEICQQVAAEAACLPRKEVSEESIKGQTDQVLDLVRIGAPLDARGDEQRTALSLAVANNHEAVVKFLIDVGAGVCVQDSTGRTPLHIAACRPGEQLIIWMLLAASPPIDVKDNAGQTALHLAAIGRCFFAAKALHLAGVRKDIKDNKGKVPTQ
ncbi:serine/threonine-protein phosphatase 6 regulatory ankyrin repeat subunit B-like [Schistocerca serialis cubense]|nr:serine/threonine-protein phosphatase 6 regulatory ankyrin repeat subunit B-like [Schistocerca serialis cubense]